MIDDRVKRVILRELELEDFELTEQTMASDVPNWDSLHHIRVINALEKEFKVRFKGVEVLRLRNLGDLQRLIDARTHK